MQQWTDLNCIWFVFPASCSHFHFKLFTSLKLEDESLMNAFKNKTIFFKHVMLHVLNL